MLVIYSTHQIRCLRAKWNIKSNMKGQNKISKRQALERKESTKEKERLWFLLCVWLALRKTNSFYNHRFFLRRSVLKQIPTINTRVGIFILVGSQHGCLLGPSTVLMPFHLLSMMAMSSKTYLFHLLYSLVQHI